MTLQYIIVSMLHVKLSQLKGLGRSYEPVDLLLPLRYLDFSMFYDLLHHKSLSSRLTRHVAQWEQRTWWLSGPISAELMCRSEFYSPVCSVSSCHIQLNHTWLISACKDMAPSLSLFFTPICLHYLLLPCVFFLLCTSFQLSVILM